MIYRGAMVAANESAANLITAIEALSQWNVNLIRWPLVNSMVQSVGWSADMYRTWLGGQLDKLALCLPALRTAGIKVVLDMHHPIGGVNAKGEHNLFNDPELRALFIQHWVEMANIYKNESTIVAYDMLNEPHPPSISQWTTLATDTAKAIRAAAPNKTIVYEPYLAQPEKFATFKPLRMSNVWYSPHFYRPNDITLQGVSGRAIGSSYTTTTRERLRNYLAPIITFQTTYNVPIYVGEFGCTRWSGYPNKENRRSWFSDCLSTFETRKWNWSYHAFREWEGWDIEMPWDPNLGTSRTETSTVTLFKRYFAKNG